MSTERSEAAPRLVVRPDLSERPVEVPTDRPERSTRVGSVAGLRTLRRRLSAWLDELGIEAPEFHSDVQLGVVELVTNAFVHGAADHVDVSASLGVEELVVVTEHAAALEIPSSPAAQPAPDSVSGRGLFIVDRLARERVVTHIDGRSRTTLWIPIVATPAGVDRPRASAPVDPAVATASSGTLR